MIWVIVLILVIVVLLLSIALFMVIKKATYLSKKERDFITYVIDIYVDYSKELGVESLEEHEVIVENLNKIKDKLKKL